MGKLRKLSPQLNEKGFTLIETLLVLAIVTIIMSVGFLYLRPLHEAKRIEQFLEQLQNDLFYSQQYAISHSETVKVVFNEFNPSYHVLGGTENNLFLERQYNPAIRIQITTLGPTLYFNSNGNIQKSGTIRVKYKDDTYVLTFLLGKGRFYVSKM